MLTVRTPPPPPFSAPSLSDTDSPSLTAGRLMPNRTFHPSSADGKGFGPLSGKIHALGLKFGFWIMGGIPRQAVNQTPPLLIEGSNYTVDEAADLTNKRNCGWQPGFVFGTRTVANNTALHPAAVACMFTNSPYGDFRDTLIPEKLLVIIDYDSVARLYKQWQVDFIKMDCVFGSDFGRGSLDLEQFSASMHKAGQPFLFSLSPGSSVSMAPKGQAFALSRAAAGGPDLPPTMARMTGE